MTSYCSEEQSVASKEGEKLLDNRLETESVSVDENLSQDLEKIMNDSTATISAQFPEDSFQAIFWRHQLESLGKNGKEKSGNRWHPMMIRWCLYLRHFSGKAYNTLRDSVCLVLPSERTLRDYSNAVKTDVGFSAEVDEQLMQAAKLLVSPSYHGLAGLLLDEMHVREELVYNKHTGKLVGFVNLGDINMHLARFEESLEASSDDYEPATSPETPLANSMMVFMVRGIFTSLRFPYAIFPCSSLHGEQLFPLFWESIFRLERIGFKVRKLLGVLHASTGTDIHVLIQQNCRFSQQRLTVRQ